MNMFKNLLGTRIKHLRQSKGMKQAELAEAAGVEINTISRYETGANAPSIEQLLNLSEALGVSPMEILPPQDPLLQRLFALRQNLIEKASQVDSPEDLEEVIRTVEILISTKRSPKK